MDGSNTEPEAVAANAEVKEEEAVQQPESSEPNVVAAAEAEAAEVKAEDGADEGEPAAGVSDSAAQKREREPVKLGFKQFNTGNEACAYFKNLMHIQPQDVDVNEYEFKVLNDLLRQGHPNAEKKIGAGLRGFQVREFNDSGALAFYVVRKDGTAEDFSYLKCCAALFDDVGLAAGSRGGKKQQGGEKPARGSGSRDGKGSGRGRGGRGNGRGRGRGRK